MENDIKGIVFNIERYTLHDGPGIRTTVFLKGCPLGCLWCSNPESQSGSPEITYFAEKCTGCGRCLPLCPQNAIQQHAPGAPVTILFERCDGCGACVEPCYPEALVLTGQSMTAQQVADVVLRDRRFYQNSGGGVTLSGGEPLAQAAFTAEVLRLCRQQGIHTAIQTSGFAPRSALEHVLPQLDLVIFDLKHLDDAEHQRLTGVSNRLILENLRFLNCQNMRVVVQMPLIPGYNDSQDNLQAVFDLVKSLPSVEGLSLLAYHALGAAKYTRAGRSYSLKDLRTPPKEYLPEKMALAEQHGVKLVRFNG
jgi:pyruvate formate lyase activating enzyme